MSDQNEQNSFNINNSDGPDSPDSPLQSKDGNLDLSKNPTMPVQAESRLRGFLSTRKGKIVAAVTGAFVIGIVAFITIYGTGGEFKGSFTSPFKNTPYSGNIANYVAKDKKQVKYILEQAVLSDTGDDACLQNDLDDCLYVEYLDNDNKWTKTMPEPKITCKTSYLENKDKSLYKNVYKSNNYRAQCGNKDDFKFKNGNKVLVNNWEEKNYSSGKMACAWASLAECKNMEKYDISTGWEPNPAKCNDKLSELDSNYYRAVCKTPIEPTFPPTEGTNVLVKDWNVYKYDSGDAACSVAGLGACQKMEFYNVNTKVWENFVIFAPVECKQKKMNDSEKLIIPPYRAVCNKKVIEIPTEAGKPILKVKNENKLAYKSGDVACYQSGEKDCSYIEIFDTKNAVWTADGINIKCDETQVNQFKMSETYRAVCVEAEQDPVTDSNNPIIKHHGDPKNLLKYEFINGNFACTDSKECESVEVWKNEAWVVAPNLKCGSGKGNENFAIEAHRIVCGTKGACKTDSDCGDGKACQDKGEGNQCYIKATNECKTTEQCVKNSSCETKGNDAATKCWGGQGFVCGENNTIKDIAEHNQCLSDHCSVEWAFCIGDPLPSTDADNPIIKYNGDPANLNVYQYDSGEVACGDTECEKIQYWDDGWADSGGLITSKVSCGTQKGEKEFTYKAFRAVCKAAPDVCTASGPFKIDSCVCKEGENKVLSPGDDKFECIDCAALSSKVKSLYLSIELEEIVSESGLAEAKKAFKSEWEKLTEVQKTTCLNKDEIVKFEAYNSIKYIEDTSTQCSELGEQIEALKAEIDLFDTTPLTDKYTMSDFIADVVTSYYAMQEKVDLITELDSCDLDPQEPGADYLPYTCDQYKSTLTLYSEYMDGKKVIPVELGSKEEVKMNMQITVEMYEYEKENHSKSCPDLDTGKFKAYYTPKTCEYFETGFKSNTDQMDAILNGTLSPATPKAAFEAQKKAIKDMFAEYDEFALTPENTCAFAKDYAPYKTKKYVEYSPQTCADYSVSLKAAKTELSAAKTKAEFDSAHAKLKSAYDASKKLVGCDAKEYDDLIASAWVEPEAPPAPVDHLKCAQNYDSKFSFYQFNINSAKSQAAKNVYITELSKIIALAEGEKCPVPETVKVLTTQVYASAPSCSEFDKDFTIIAQFIQASKTEAEMGAYKGALQQRMDDAKAAGCTPPIELLGVMVAQFVETGVVMGATIFQNGVVAGTQSTAAVPTDTAQTSTTGDAQALAPFGAWPQTSTGKSAPKGQSVGTASISGFQTPQQGISPVGMGQPFPQAQPGAYGYAQIPAKTGPESQAYVLIFLSVVLGVLVSKKFRKRLE